MLQPIRYLIAHGLVQAKYDSTIIAPLLNIFTLLDNELSMLNFEMSPELSKELEKLDQAILLLSDEGIEDPDLLDDDEDEDDLDEDEDDDLWDLEDRELDDELDDDD
jgi:hypothetical protein